jgi:ribosomal protein L20
MHDGTARNVEGQRIYGKSWSEISPAIRLTGAAMDEAKAKAESLNLVIGKEGIAQAEGYRKAMAGVHAVFDGIEKAIGDALMPGLTRLAQWFVSIGPAAVEATKAVLVSLYAVFENLMAVGVTVTETLMGVWEGFGRVVQLVFETVQGFITGGPKGAKEAWDRNFQQIEDAARKHTNAVIQAWQDAATNVDQLAERVAAKDTPTTDTGGKNQVQDDEAGKSRMGDWQTALEEKKAAFQEEAAAEGQLREFSKQQEIAYWQEILATTKTSLEERKSIRAKIASDELAIDKGRLEGSLAGLKNEEAAAGQNLAARLAAEQKYAEAVKGIYGTDSKEYAQAQKQITATHEAELRQRQQIDMIEAKSARELAIQEIDAAEAAAKQKQSLNQMSLSQLIALEKNFAAQRYAIHQQELAQDIALMQQDPNYNAAALAQLQAQNIQLTTQYQAQLLKINQQSTTQQEALQKQLTGLMTTSFSSAFSGILKGTETVKQGMQKMFTSIVEGVIDMFARWLAQEITTTATSLVLNKQQQTAQANTAATGAGASAAAVPYIGWALAIGAMASVFAAASGYSGAEGFDIPRGLNPRTQLHSEEMVLPAKIANPLRENLATGGGVGGGTNYHVHASMVDVRGLKQMFRKGGVLEKEVRSMHRRGIKP